LSQTNDNEHLNARSGNFVIIFVGQLID
jgi:hypothetical protein